MTQPLHIEEQTYRDMTAVLFPKRDHSKLAHCGVEFVIKSMEGDGSTIELDTLRRFVDFLIKSKGYN